MVALRALALTRLLRAAAIAAGVGCLAACALGPNYRVPAADAPASFAAQTRPQDPDDLAAWWRMLNDAKLDSLVDRAVRSNLDVAIALDRLQQARTYEAVMLGAALPEVDTSAAAGRGTGTDLTKGRADQILRSADTGTGLAHINTIAGFSAAWELDVFGKFRREIEAARDDAAAARAAREDVLTAVVADVVRAYIDLRGFQVQAGILHKSADLLRESLSIVEIRYQRGITNELDVALAKRELATLEARIAPLHARANAAQYTLAVLVGEYPENLLVELDVPDLVPAMPATVAPGVPPDLLKRRADIRQAERELAAATARVGVATAGLFPSISLSAAIGAQGQGWGTVPSVGRHIWSFGPGALWPLLDFGSLDAQLDIAGIAAHAALMNYRKTLLNAVGQVDAALDGYRAQLARQDALGTAMLAAERAVDLATQRYERGLTDFLNVVDAQRQYYELQEEYAQAQVAEGDEFVQLYKSLGGGWQNYQAVPAIRRPQPAIIAAFRRSLAP